MPNVLFDLIATQPIYGSTYHGGGKYAKCIFLALLEAKKNGCLIVAVWDGSKELDKMIGEEIMKNQLALIDINNDSLVNIVDKFNISTIYSALPLLLEEYGLFTLSSCRIITTIHGVRPLEIQATFGDLAYIPNRHFKQKFVEFIKVIFKSFFVNREKRKFKMLLDHAEVVAVSNHTKYSIMTFFPEISSRIPVFYSPDISDLDDGEDFGVKMDLQKKEYFLMVSGDRWLKNNIRSAVALDQVFTKFPDISKKAVIVGVISPSIYLKHIKNKEKFIFEGYVSESKLKYLYRNCYSLLYMSLNEGFGYPPLEAMKYGRPVVTSPHTSIFEICGDSVLYANPYSIQEIEARILCLFEGSVYDALEAKSLVRYEEVAKKQKSDLESLVGFISS